MSGYENVTLGMVYDKLQYLQNKVDEIEFVLETEHIHPITNAKAIRKLKAIDEDIAKGKRKVMSEKDFFCKY